MSWIGLFFGAAFTSAVSFLIAFSLSARTLSLFDAPGWLVAPATAIAWTAIALGVTLFVAGWLGRRRRARAPSGA